MALVYKQISILDSLFRKESDMKELSKELDVSDPEYYQISETPTTQSLQSLVVKAISNRKRKLVTVRLYQ